MPLTETAIQEQLSLAFCHAVLSRAGLSFSTSPTDHGIDVMVNYVAEYDGERHDSGAVLALQIKAARGLNIGDEYVHYPLRMEAYRRLKSPCAQPKILVVYAMPVDINLWLSCAHDHFRMEHCGYWIKAIDIPDADGNLTSTTVRIPKANLFTVQAISELAAPQIAMLEEGA